MIYDLRQRPQHIPLLAQWHHAEWAHINPGFTLEQRIEKMQSYLGAAWVPSTFVWEDETGAPLGSAAIVDSDMDTHPEYWPWLASVFVRPDCRGQGIGGRLVRHVMTSAQKQGIPRLYLFTPDRAAFYQALGWKVVGQEDYRGEHVTVMQTELIVQL